MLIAAKTPTCKCDSSKNEESNELELVLCREEKVGRYQRGAHRSILYLHIFLRVLQLEKQHVQDVCAFTNMSGVEVSTVNGAFFGDLL